MLQRNHRFGVLTGYLSQAPASQRLGGGIHELDLPLPVGYDNGFVHASQSCCQGLFGAMQPSAHPTNENSDGQEQSESDPRAETSGSKMLRRHEEISHD